MVFENASVVITGGSRGIGLSVAKVFAKQSRRPIVLIARDAAALKDAKRECEAAGAVSVETIAADLSKRDALSDIDMEASNPGILVNAAGFFLLRKLQDTAFEEFEQQFAANVLTAFNAVSAILPALLKRDRGLIVNICSKDALQGNGESGAYSMSKHALLGYSRSLRQELLHTGVAVTAINLGQTYSTSWEGVDIDAKKLILPEDVGKIILSLSELSPQSVVEEINLMPAGGPVSPK